MSYDVVTQAVGIIATIFVIYAYTKKNDNDLKLWHVLANLTFAIHFCMLGAFTGAVIASFNCFRIGFSIRYYQSTRVMSVFLFAYVLIGFLLSKEFVDWFPIISTMISTYGVYKLSGIRLRLLSLVGSFSWLFYSIIYHSIGGMLTEFFVISANILTIYSLSKEEKYD